jgi:DNA ligase-1
MSKYKPTLYKRTVTGAVQSWTIHVEGSKYWTVSGKDGGKMVTNDPVQCVAKHVGKSNETTPEEQCKLEAQAKWYRKKESGYAESILEVDAVVAGIVKPTLAKDFKDYQHVITWPVYSQPKFDGLRCIITRDGAYSRNWKPFFTLAHIREALAPIFAENPNIVAFDGEVYNHLLKDDFNEIVSLVKQPKATAEDIERAKDKIEYHVYDYVDKNQVSFTDRSRNLLIYLLEVEETYIQIVETRMVGDMEQLDELYDLYLEGGYEGQMVRHPDAPYEHQRTSSLLKRKEFIDEEFPIVGFKEGKGNREGCIIIRCRNDRAQEFDCSVKGSVEYTRKLYNMAPALVGMLATVKYQRLTPDGIPKFLTCIKFRDKNGEELIAEQ